MTELPVYRCGTCGSTNIEVLHEVYIRINQENTLQELSDAVSNSIICQDCYCHDCDNHRNWRNDYHD